MHTHTHAHVQEQGLTSNAFINEKAKVLVAQLCPTLCDPMDCSPPGSSVHGDSSGKSTRVGSKDPFARGSSQSGDGT